MMSFPVLHFVLRSLAPVKRFEEVIGTNIIPNTLFLTKELWSLTLTSYKYFLCFTSVAIGVCNGAKVCQLQKIDVMIVVYLGKLTGALEVLVKDRDLSGHLSPGFSYNIQSC